MTLLTPGAIRERIKKRPPLELITGDQGHRRVGHARRPAAVLVGVLGRLQPTVILTQRTAHLKDHGGQISFPGGRMEEDDPDPAAAALREAEEEIGLTADRCRILGELSPYDTITGFRVFPIVAWVEPPVTLRPDPFEVEEVFEVPLDFIVQPKNHHRETYIKNEIKRTFWVVPYQNRYIWGATAGMLVNFARLLSEAHGSLMEP